MGSLSEPHFAWNNAARSFAAFQTEGMETRGEADTRVVEMRWGCDAP